MPRPPAEFSYDDIRLVGCSLAGEESYVIAPEMNLAFDVGRAQQALLGVDNLFLSHGHMDHAAGIAYYFSQRMFIEAPVGTLYAPATLVDPIRDLLAIWRHIDGHLPDAKVVAANPLEDIPLRKNLIVRPFSVHHPGRGRRGGESHALGYTAIEVRKKLKDEYTELTGPQLVELKKQGVEITRRVELPLVSYSGDTGPGEFFEHDFVKNSRVFLLECTFVELDHRDRARAGNHMHLQDLKRVLPHLNNERIVLTHLTRRTAIRDAKALLRRELGAEADERVSFLMEHRRRRRSPHGPQRPAERHAPDASGR